MVGPCGRPPSNTMLYGAGGGSGSGSGFSFGRNTNANRTQACSSSERAVAPAIRRRGIFDPGLPWGPSGSRGKTVSRPLPPDLGGRSRRRRVPVGQFRRWCYHGLVTRGHRPSIGSPLDPRIRIHASVAAPRTRCLWVQDRIPVAITHAIGTAMPSPSRHGAVVVSSPETIAGIASSDCASSIAAIRAVPDRSAANSEAASA